MRLLTAVLLSLFIFSANAAPIKKWVDEDGKTQYSNIQEQQVPQDYYINLSEFPLTRHPLFDKNSERLSLNFNKVSIGSIFQILSDFSGLKIVLNNSIRQKIMNIRYQNESWNNIFWVVIKEFNLKAVIFDDVIVVIAVESFPPR